MPSILDLWADMAGVFVPYAGQNAPNGWLLCHGQAVSRTTYNNLFKAIGITWGAGDGSTTFNVPDLRGRVPAGKDNMGGVAAGRLTDTGTGNSGINGNVLGAAGGVDRHTLTAAQMPSHSHDMDVNSSAAQGPRLASGTGTAGSGAIQTGTAGSGQAHPNVQPTIVANYIIKT